MHEISNFNGCSLNHFTFKSEPSLMYCISRSVWTWASVNTHGHSLASSCPIHTTSFGVWGRTMPLCPSVCLLYVRDPLLSSFQTPPPRVMKSSTWVRMPQTLPTLATLPSHVPRAGRPQSWGQCWPHLWLKPGQKHLREGVHLGDRSLDKPWAGPQMWTLSSHQGLHMTV